MEAGREGRAAFLRRIADFLESHGNDEGGYSEETRRQFVEDAARLRLEIGACPWGAGDRVIVTDPWHGDIAGTVPRQPANPNRIPVLLDGRKSVMYYHPKFIRDESSHVR